MREILKETYSDLKKMSGIDARNPKNFKSIISDDNAFSVYKKGLSEGLNEEDLKVFDMLAENTRTELMENSMFQLNPYETLTMPVLRVFFPKLIAKELVNVMPIDKPDVIKAFIRAYFKRVKDGGVSGAGTYTGYDYEFPSVSQDISRGPNVGITVAADATSGAEKDVLAVANLTAADSHIEKDFKIIGIYDATNGYTAVDILPTVDGIFSQSVTHENGEEDMVSGKVDYLNGTFIWSSAYSTTSKVKFQAICSLEENKINPVIKYDVEKIPFKVVDRRISAEWSINIQQDLKALFDLDLQSELVKLIGEQIALDIDREIINSLISANTTQNPASHRDTFDLKPPTDFYWGRKAWFENIIPIMNTLSAQVYNSCLMGAANTVACNPLDAAVFESLNNFNYTGNSVDGGEAGYRSAVVAGGKWKILVSSIVPQGSVILKYRSSELTRAAFVYAPYVPAFLTPYPFLANPSMTILSRYSSRVIRPNAIAVMTITDTSV